MIAKTYTLVNRQSFFGVIGYADDACLELGIFITYAAGCAA